MTEDVCCSQYLACTCSYQSDSAPTEQQSRLSWSRESVHVSMQCVCMSMNMIVVHGFYPFVVRQATPQPRRRFDDLSRLIDGLWHLQTGTTTVRRTCTRQARAVSGGSRRHLSNAVRLRRCTRRGYRSIASELPYATAVRSKVRERSQGAGWVASHGHSRNR